MKFIEDLDRSKVVRVRALGISINWGKAPITAYQFYEVWLKDGSTEFVRGHTVRTQKGSEDFNRPNAYTKMTLREDLDVPMRGAYPLFEAISAAAEYIDEVLSVKQAKKRARKPAVKKKKGKR